MPRLISVDNINCITATLESFCKPDKMKLLIEDVSLIVTNKPTVGGWINVKDRLPDEGWTDYLVATRLCNGTIGVNIAWLDAGVWRSTDEQIRDGRKVVTHWMPLPKLPTNGDE